MKRVVAFFDCQNLFNAAKKLWDYSFPNFDPIKLAYLTSEKCKEEKCKEEFWKLEGIRLYTGIHNKNRNPELFSQDSDFSEAAQEVRAIADESGRWIKIVSAYPYEVGFKIHGVDKTDWIPISRAEYDACIDPMDYRIDLTQ